MNHPSFVEIMRKRLTIVYACVEISSTVSFVEEIEEGISLRCLYRILLDINSTGFSLHNFSSQQKKSILNVLEKLFLKKNQISVECAASYVKLCAQLAVTCRSDPAMCFCLIHFIKHALMKYSKLTNLLEEDNEGVGLNIYDPFVADPYSANGFHTEIITDMVKLLEVVEVLNKEKPLKLYEDIKMMVDRIIERNPLPQNLIASRPSGVYAMLSKKELE